MLNNISIGKYYSAKSNIHFMHPLSKIICTLIFLILALVAFDLRTILGLVIITIFVIMNTNIPLIIYYNLIKNLKIFLTIIFLFFLLVTFSFYTSLVITSKIILIILYISILTLTTPTTEIVYGLEKTLYPLERFNIKSNILALNIGLSLRFIPTLIDTRNNILVSQINRGLDYRNNFKSYIKAMKNMLSSVFLLSIRKFKKLRESMFIRLYSVNSERCNFRINDFKLFDFILILLHVTLLVVVILKGVII